MCAEENKQLGESINAIDYIKSSQIFSNGKYSWFTPLITKVLDGQLEEGDVDNLINSITTNSEKKEREQNSFGENPKNDEEKFDHSNSIKRICKIDKISNIGLIELDNDDAIELREGLNVFYGKNGAGKSSIYLGLCKVLGKEKSVFSNVNNDCDDSCCHVTCLNEDGQEIKLAWETGGAVCNEKDVKIFDGTISNFIVREDQINQFQMAHLKIEFFSLLHDFYDSMETKISEETSRINSGVQVLEKTLTNNVPFIFSIDFKLDVDEGC
jgi:hypothetical protein